VTRLTLLCWLAACAALAAPVPESKDASGFKGPEWGKPVGANKECKFTFAKGSLTVEVPAGQHALVPGKKGRPKAPHILRRAKGDFEAQVRVRGDYEVSPADGFGQLTAGLVVLDKDGPVPSYRVVFGARCVAPRRGEPPAAPRRKLHAAVSMEDTKRGLESFPPTKGWAVTDGGKAWQAYLKVTRRGGELRSYLSPDGKEWSLNARLSREGLPPHLHVPEDKIAGEVRVGVAAFNLSADKCKVTFDQWKFTPLKAEAKAKAEKKAEAKAEKKPEAKGEKKTEKK
jgi:regulation of enolase protein 1 (concanavalin A-like superfamily)